MPKTSKEIFGLSVLVDEPPGLPPLCCFKQFTLQETITLHTSSSAIGRIIKLTPEVLVSNTRMVKTLECASQEGRIYTGRNLAVQGELAQRIEYISDIQSSQVDAEYICIPFNEYIPVHPGLKTVSPMTAAGYVEDISIELLDERTIYISSTILLVAEY